MPLKCCHWQGQISILMSDINIKVLFYISCVVLQQRLTSRWWTHLDGLWDLSLSLKKVASGKRVTYAAVQPNERTSLQLIPPLICFAEMKISKTNLNVQSQRQPASKIDFSLMYIYQMFETRQTGRRLMASVLLTAELHLVLTFWVWVRSKRMQSSPEGFLQVEKLLCMYEQRRKHAEASCVPSSVRWSSTWTCF